MLGDFRRKLATLTSTPGLPVVRSGNRVWHVTPNGMALFGSAGPQIEEWIANGSAVVVKTNPARTVYRVELAHGTVFVKHCRVTTPQAWGRELIRPPKARLEFDKAFALRKRGVPAVEPLAWATTDSRWPGESFLITRGLAAVPFINYLDGDFANLPTGDQLAARRLLTHALARFFANLHDAGIAHPDPHPGNLLLEWSHGVVHFSLIDVHDVHIGSPLSWRLSRDNLALFNRYFQMRTTRPERLRFWRIYREIRRTLPTTPQRRTQAKELEAHTHASNLRLWAGREHRWLGSNRSIRRVRHGNMNGFAVRDLPDEFLQKLLQNPDAVFTQLAARLLKSCTSSTVAVIPMPTVTGMVSAIFKRVNADSWVDSLKNLFRRSHVLRSWSNGHCLRDRQLPTPRPLAVFHRSRSGLPAEGYLLMEMVPDAVQLDEAVRSGLPSGTLHKLARVLRAMHDRGVSHRDLKAPNILLAHGTEPALIDLVGVRTQAHLTVERRAKELTRLNASFANHPSVTHSDRLQFLSAYLAAGPSLGVGWKSWWELVSRGTAEKLAKNRRAGRVLG